MAKARSGSLADWVAGSAVPMLVVDERRRVRVFNRGMEQFSGLTAGDVIGRRVPETGGDSPVERFLDAIGFDPELLSGPPRQIETVFRLASGDRTATLLILPLELPDDAAGGSRVLFCISETLAEGIAEAAVLVDRAALRRASADIRRHFGLVSFVGLSEVMRPVLRRLKAARDCTASVVITGAPGTGRTHAALSLLSATDRHVTLDAAALLPAEFKAALARIAEDSELKDATVFMRHVERLSEENQNLLAEHLNAVRRRALVTGTENPGTALLAAAGDIQIELPRLRDRDGDLRLLAHAFLERAAADESLSVARFDESAMHELERYGWPGELKELKAVVGEAVRATGRSGRTVVSADDLPVRFRAGQHAERLRDLPPVRPLAEVVEEAERQAIIDCLRQCRGNKSRAATLLGVSRPKFYHRLEALGISGEDALPNDDA